MDTALIGNNRLWVIWVVMLLGLVGCGGDAGMMPTAQRAVDLPTVFVLPSLTPSDTPTATVTASATFTPTLTLTASLTPSPTATPRATLTPYPHRMVVIAARPLPIGATINESAVRLVAVPYEAAPLNAHGDLAGVVGKIARTHFFCGQAILQSMTVDSPAEVAAQTARIANLADCAGGELPVPRAPYQFTEVVIAAQDMAAGRVIPAGGVERALWLTAFTPDTAMLDAEAVVGQRLVLDVYIGQPILVDLLGGE